ncbi:hypothetical protein ES705_17151 [subsurface metagenome]
MEMVRAFKTDEIVLRCKKEEVLVLRGLLKNHLKKDSTSRQLEVARALQKYGEILHLEQRKNKQKKKKKP